MSASRPRSPRSLAIVVLLALVLGSAGFAGSAYAADLTAKQVKKIAAKVIKKQAPKLSVAHATTADSATTAASAGDAAKLAGAAPSAYLDRGAHENLTTVVDNIASATPVQVMNATQIDVPAGVGFIHVTAVASFTGGTTTVVVWPMLDSTCAPSGTGWDHRSYGSTDAGQDAIAVDFFTPVSAGTHGVRLCAQTGGASVDVSNRSLTITTVAGDFNG